MHNRVSVKKAKNTKATEEPSMDEKQTLVDKFQLS